MSKLSHSDDTAMEIIEARRISDGFFQADEEANAFAMELLMPARFLREDIREMGGFDIDDERAVKKLSSRYRVSMTVMALRLGQLFAESDDGKTPRPEASAERAEGERANTTPEGK